MLKLWEATAYYMDAVAPFWLPLLSKNPIERPSRVGRTQQIYEHSRNIANIGFIQYPAHSLFRYLRAFPDVTADFISGYRKRAFGVISV